MATVTGTANDSMRENESTSIAHSGEELHFSPFFYAKPAVERPCTTCCALCCGLALFMMILVGILASGVEVLRFVSEVPFYLYHSTPYKDQVALFSAFDVANARLDGALVEREQADSDFELKVIYESSSGTVFTPTTLAGIKRLEEQVVGVTDYVNFCTLNYALDPEDPPCVRHNSAISYFDPAWWVPALDPPPNPTVPSALNAELVLSQSKIAGLDPDNYYAFANPQNPEQDSDNVDLSQENVDAMVQYWSGYCSNATDCPAAANGDQSPYAMTVDGSNITISNPSTFLVNTDFGIQGDEVVSTGRALLSVFYFGTPQVNEDTGELFGIDTNDIEDQKVELGNFLLDHVSDILEEGSEGVEVFWDGSTNGMQAVYQDNILMNDATLLLPSILFIVIYLMFQLRSWWLGGVGILMILGNFGPALLFYRLFSGYSYFGTLNALAVFLVLGIGADDIFVFSNTWRHVRQTHPELTVLRQLNLSLFRGGKAMLVTSITTAVSFLINASSAFPAIQSFGIFSALLILTNYFSVITVYPAATMVHEYYFNDPDAKRGCCRTTCGCCKAEKGFPRETGNEDEETSKDSIVNFFKNRFYPFMHKFRIPALVIYGGIIIFYIVVGSQLEPDSESPSLLPDEDQYVRVTDKLEEYFSHSDVTDRITAQIPFGILGTDRDDCDGDECDITVPTDYGAPVWDENIVDGLSDEYAQKWFLDFCDALANREGTDDLLIYEPDESNPSPVACPFQGFQAWCVQETGRCSQTHPSLGTDEYIIDADQFEDTLVAFLGDEVPTTDGAIPTSDTTNFQVWEEYIRFESTDDSSDETPTLRYVTVEVLLSARVDLEFEKGIDLYEDWKAFLEKWTDLANTEEYQGADTAVSSAFVTDKRSFHWFHLQEKIIQEAFTGIGLSLFFAFIIMCLATSNWIVSGLATFTIASMVGGVVTFTVLNGWKLGVLEAVLFVMVVGFSVDYTIHLSDSYLESKEKTRGARARDMLTTMGVSVLSGAISTIGATIPLLFAYFVFFLKFGTVIFFIIAQSLLFALFFYSAMLDLFGPEEPTWGANIKKGQRVVVGDHGSNGSGGDMELDIKKLQHGKVTAVDSTDETCTVALDEAGSNDQNGGTEITVPTARCRQRYQAGHIAFIDKGAKTLSRALERCCGGSGKGNGATKGSRIAGEA